MKKGQKHRFIVEMDARQAWIWKRLGTVSALEKVAPSHWCAECGTATPDRDSLNGWFCRDCDAELKAADYQPGDEVAKLRRDNAHLQQINRDNAQMMQNMRRRLKRLEAKQTDN